MSRKRSIPRKVCNVHKVAQNLTLEVQKFSGKTLKLYSNKVNVRKMSVNFLLTQPAHTIHNKNKSLALQLSFIPFKDNIEQVNEMKGDRVSEITFA